jgi:hypothetical protein
MSMMNPLAGPSGPSKFSTRTDLPPSKEYGDRKQTAEIIGAAATSTSPGIADTNIRKANVSPAPTSSAVTPLFATTERKEESITKGLADGELQMRSQFAQQKVSDALAAMLPYDTTGEIGILYQQAVARGM